MDSKGAIQTVDSDQGQSEEEGANSPVKLPLRKRLWSVLWDSLDKTPEERKFIAKIDCWILSYCCVSYFVKYLDQTNLSPHSTPICYKVRCTDTPCADRSVMPTFRA